MKKNTERSEHWVRAVKHFKNYVVMLRRRKDVFNLVCISLFSKSDRCNPTLYKRYEIQGKSGSKFN